MDQRLTPLSHFEGPLLINRVMLTGIGGRKGNRVHCSLTGICFLGNLVRKGFQYACTETG